MVLVDSSIWIEFLAGRLLPRPSEDDLLRFVTCGPIVQEVLQGLRDSPMGQRFREYFLALPAVGNPVPISTFVAAADIYREGRRRGLTIRSSVDSEIAAIAIANGIPVWHRDRDFTNIAKFTTLRVLDRL